MKWLGRHPISPIGIDLGSRAIKAVQMRLGRGGERGAVVASATLLRKDSEAPMGIEDITRLAQVLNRRGFRGNDVVLAAPANRLESDMLELPARSSGAPVDDLASAEIARSAKLDAGTYEAACWDVPVARAGAGTGTSVLAVALRHEDAEAVIAPFDRVGLKVRAIEPASCALARGMTYLSKQGNSGADAEKSIVALLDLGWRAGTVNLISDGQVLYQRALFDCGVGPLYRQLSEKHGIDDEAADVVLCDAGAPEAAGAVVSSLVQGFVAQVAEEVSASLAFARHRYSGRTVRQVMLAGGGAKIRGLAQGMAGAIELSVEVLGAHGQSDGATANGEPAQLALATGLALHREEA